MGATNEIKETNLSLQLVDKECATCSQKFTETEINEQNYEVYFDTSNEVKLEELKEGYYFSIWIRNITHQDCPDTRTCQSCDERLLVEKMTEFNDEYYCFPCYRLTIKEKDYE